MLRLHRRASPLALLILLALTHCGPSATPDAGGPPQCTPGMSVACACDDGRMSAQVCLDNGTYGACHCAGTDAGAADVIDAAPIGIDGTSGIDAADAPAEADAPTPVDVFDGSTPMDAADAPTDPDASVIDVPVQPDASVIDVPVQPDASSAINRTCATAMPVANGTRLTDQDLAAAQEDLTCGTVVAHHVLYYSANVPAGQTLIISTVGKGPVWWTPTIQLEPTCGAAQCQDSETSRVIYTNTTGVAQSVVFAIGSDRADYLGNFDLAVDIVPPPDNAVCAAATVVTDGTVLRREDLGAAPLVSGTRTGCGYPTNPRYYRATLPVGYRMTVTATPTERVWNASVYVYSDCTLATCYASAAGSQAGDAARLFVGNSSGTAPVDVIIAVDRASGSRTGTYDLEVSIQPVSPVTMCSAARTVTDGTVLLGEYTYARNSVCNAGATFYPYSSYYRVTVPAGQQLYAVAYPRGGTTTSLYVADSCGPGATCTGTGIGSSQPIPTWVRWANTGTAPRDVILDAYGDGYPTAYDLYVAFEPVTEYVESTTPTACDDMTGALQLADLSDRSVPSYMPRLPFDFVYFGETVHYVDASSVNVMKLSGNVAIPGFVFSSSSLPSPDAPNDIVAPFWGGAAAYPSSYFMHSTSHGQVFGTAPNRHYTVEWKDLYVPSVTGSNVRVQVKLFEGSNRIEMHYCVLTPESSPQVTGSTSTVGFENATGTRGMLHSRNTAGALSSTTALVYTPR